MPSTATNSSQNIYSFGMVMFGRSYSAAMGYRFGFNKGSEKDNEIYGEGNTYSTFYRDLDTRLGIWWGCDPESKPWESPYVSMGDNPIKNNDVRGNTVDGGGDKLKIGASASLSFTAGTKGQSHVNFAVGLGLSQTSGSFMGSANLSLNIANGGWGTTQGSTGGNPFGGMAALGLAATMGKGTGTRADLNMLTGNTLSGVSNVFNNSLSIGTNLSYNTGTGFNRDFGIAGKSGGFTMNIYEDFSKFHFLRGGGLLASGKDEGLTGGGQAGYTYKNGSSVTGGVEVFTGKPLYPKIGDGNGYNIQPTQRDYDLNTGTTFLKLNNFQNIGNLRLDYTGRSQMWSQSAIHSIFGYDFFKSTAVNSLQVTHN